MTLDILCKFQSSDKKSPSNATDIKDYREKRSQQWKPEHCCRQCWEDTHTDLGVMALGGLLYNVWRHDKSSLGAVSQTCGSDTIEYPTAPVRMSILTASARSTTRHASSSTHIANPALWLASWLYKQWQASESRRHVRARVRSSRLKKFELPYANLLAVAAESWTQV